MKQLIVVFFISISATTMAQQTTFKTAWLEKWNNSKNYLIDIAEAMPEEFYDYKPTERQMTFKEQLLHIKGNMDWLSNTYFTATAFDKTIGKQPSTKIYLIEHIKAAFDSTYFIIESTPDEDLSDTVEFFTGKKSKIQILNLLQDHVSHHRGQLIVYLNLKNIETPEFVGW
ncbi:hypothetical protein SCB49_06457 [unidentified eubacterium SCB49]|nr:hypothetical protein SCB49_06457 [unidentified eubacterium SCB49]